MSLKWRRVEGEDGPVLKLTQNGFGSSPFHSSIMSRLILPSPNTHTHTHTHTHCLVLPSFLYLHHMPANPPIPHHTHTHTHTHTRTHTQTNTRASRVSPHRLSYFAAIKAITLLFLPTNMSFVAG